MFAREGARGRLFRFVGFFVARTVTSGLSSHMAAGHNRCFRPRTVPMRRLPLTLLSASLMLAIGTANAATQTTVPAAAVKTAEQLRDTAMNDNTAYKIVE